MKPFLSWLLLLITSFHWMGGYLCFQLNYAVEIEREMNEVERKIAEAVKEEMGMDLFIEIVTEDQFNVNNFGYSGRFLFSKEIEGQKYYYEINPDPVETVYQEYLICQYSDSDGSTDKMIIFQRLFSKFTVQDLSPSLADKHSVLTKRNFNYVGFQDIFQASIPGPPPKWI